MTTIKIWIGLEVTQRGKEKHIGGEDRRAEVIKPMGSRKSSRRYWAYKREDNQ